MVAQKQTPVQKYCYHAERVGLKQMVVQMQKAGKTQQTEKADCFGFVVAQMKGITRFSLRYSALGKLHLEDSQMDLADSFRKYKKGISDPLLYI